MCEDVHVCSLKNRLYFVSQSYKTNPRMESLGLKLLCVMGGRR